MSRFLSPIVLGITLTVSVKVSAAPVVDFCALFDASGAYQGKTVSSQAYMSYSNVTRVDGGDTFLYSPSCNSTDYFAIPYPNRRDWEKWTPFFDSLKPESDFICEVKFEGKIDIENSSLFGHLGWARAQIKAFKVKSIKDITSESSLVLPDANAPTPLIDRIKQVQVTVRAALESLFSNKERPDYLREVVLDDFVFTNVHGKTFNKKQYLETDSPGLDVYKSTTHWELSFELKRRTREMLVYRGKIKLIFDDHQEKTLRSDMTFVLRGDDWLLQRQNIVSR